MVTSTRLKPLTNEDREINIDADLVMGWIEALESGEYEQGRQFLKRGDNYCCLGVLCDVAIKQGKVNARWDARPGDEFRDVANLVVRGDWSELQFDTSLPEEVYRKVGMYTGEGAVYLDGMFTPYQYDAPLDRDDVPTAPWMTRKPTVLTYANDSLRWNFAQIAAALRKRYGLPQREG